MRVYPKPEFWFKDLAEELEKSSAWGRWDCKSKEMIVGIVCHIEVLKLNQRAILWQ